MGDVMNIQNLLMIGIAKADGNFAFFGFVAGAALTLLALITIGVRRRQTPRGKLIAMVASLLLFILFAGAGLILMIADSAQHGAPM
jgi:hypothetical protein